MPHRDPETGEFLSGDHAGAMAQADDILVMQTGFKVGDTASGADYGIGTQDAHETLDFQKDYRVLGVEVFVETLDEAHADGTDSTGSRAITRANMQLATTGSYAAPATEDQGGAMAAGVYWHRTVSARVGHAWEDETNGTGGYLPGSHTVLDEFIPAEAIVNADVTRDAGTSLSLHVDVTRDGQASSQVGYVIEARFFVEERDD